LVEKNGSHVTAERQVAAVAYKFRRQGNRERAAIGHGIARIDREVEQGKLDLVVIRQSRRQPRRHVELDGDRRANRATQKVGHAPHQFGEVGRPRFERLAAGKGQQALGERRAALGALCGAIDQAVDAGIGWQALAQELEIAQHGRQ
jgi:hypothetical protein